ncbi:MAG: hypothetical protein P8Q50_00930 [Octadecabacter sp.]|nr:hypothetical protein [Octadecabacter sp.]
MVVILVPQEQTYAKQLARALVFGVISFESVSDPRLFIHKDGNWLMGLAVSSQGPQIFCTNATKRLMHTICAKFRLFPPFNGTNPTQGLVYESFYGIAVKHLGIDCTNARENAGIQVDNWTALI